ncbi:serine/threonine-protein kinase RsbT [Thalassobacillus cyri]|uniref:Serine/threonine-protein kinase RsbT n=1 Tax=Thalassobacillus cyri TaxID=571932 RepID=A0A1H3VSN8_9BACI|nr:anti-sigma regulatory factor [Thalassobacillus cyri]SDZ77780.1 serine/threonine-protein kinase RsbT [Thalassobacillus cyri]
MENSIVIPITCEDDIVLGRKMGREFSERLGFSTLSKTRVITAVSELARNIYRYAEDGWIKLEVVQSSHKKGLRITAVDKGPGIRNIREALTVGYSSSGSLGAGLPGTKKMMDEFKIDSSPDLGTQVIAVKWVNTI